VVLFTRKQVVKGRCTMSQITWDDSYSVGNDAIDA
jgi:hypothetical protein